MAPMYYSRIGTDGAEVDAEIVDLGAGRAIRINLTDEEDGHAAVDFTASQAEQLGTWLLKAAIAARSGVLR